LLFHNKSNSTPVGATNRLTACNGSHFCALSQSQPHLTHLATHYFKGENDVRHNHSKRVLQYPAELLC
jgi:uncharacterized protein (DUF1499 family)